MVNLTDEFEKKLKSQIESIESKSPIEIVPAIIEKASDYTSWSIILGLILAYVPSRMIAHGLPIWSSYVLLLDALIWLVLGFFIAFVLRKLGLYTYLAPKSLLQMKAVEKAESIFLREGIFETKKRIGILIAVFQAEKSVIVLADKGFNDLVAKDYWARLGATLAKDFNCNKPGDEFFEALKEIEHNVAPKFKLDGENPNELSDDLRKK
jgi:uncharacterized membrane protein